VFENSVLTRIFSSKRKEMVEGWRRPHNEELHNLYTSPHIFRVIKSWRMRWAGHVTHKGEIRNVVLWLENLKRRSHSEDLGVDGKIILEGILGK
jgi:hypothetical protein